MRHPLPEATTSKVVDSSSDSAQSTGKTTDAVAEASTAKAETKQQQPQLNSSEGGAKPGSTSSAQEKQEKNPQ